jgi:uncharacterized protein (TIGR02246 family)
MSIDGAADDQIGIRALIDTYADAVFRRDAAAWGATWDQDAEWTLFGMRVRGREAIVAAWEQAMAAFPFAAFFCQLGALTVEGDQAHGRSYTNEILTTADGGVRRVVGGYQDRFIKRDGRWLFAARDFSPLLEH